MLVKFSPVIVITFLFLAGNLVFAQQYGGRIKLKITYEDRPLVGYTITGSINGHDIGGKGVTDRNGEVILNSDPLPIPNIDVKGVSECGNTKREWEASGFVYVSASNDNFYHLDLKQVADQMTEYMGIPLDMVMESFGLNCPGALGGGATSSATSTPPSNSSPQNSTSQGATDLPESTIDPNDLVLGKGEFIPKKEEPEEDDIHARTKQQSEEMREKMNAEQTPEQGFENQKLMLENKIVRLDEKIRNTQTDLESDKLSNKERNELMYDERELTLELKEKELKLEEVNLKLASPNFTPSLEARRDIKSREDEIKDEMSSIKEDRKNGVSLVKESGESSSADESEDNELDENDELTLYTEAEIQNMSIVELKKKKLEINTKIQKRKFTLKAKASLLKEDRKRTIESEIVSLEAVSALMETEILRRKEEKEQ